MIRNLFLLAGLVLLSACSDSATSIDDATSAETTPTIEAAKPFFGPWGVDVANLDDSIAPGDDFFRYVNGKWLDENEIPADRSSFGLSLMLHETAQEQVRGIIEELGAKDSAKDTPEQKVGDYYASWMDTKTLNNKGIAPLNNDLARIASIKNADELAAEFGRVHYVFGTTPIFQGLGIDSRDPDRYLLNIGLGGLGLPEKSYYQDETEKFQTIRGQYRDHIAEMLSFAGTEDALAKADEVLALETKIASYQWERGDRRDRDKTNNPTTIADLKAAHPDFNWSNFLEAGNIRGITEVNVNHPDTISPLVNLINNEPLEVWKHYLTYNMISNNGSVLSEEIDTANFDFWGGVINGQEAQLDRWKRGVSRVGGRNGLGEALGQIYVDRYFPPASKAQMVELVENMRAAYGERIRDLDWMTEPTKKEALAKLAAFRAKIGYPDKWLDLDPIVVAKEDLFGNNRRIRQFFEDRDVERLNQPTDREEWFMTPQTVNAYYLSNFNEIVFPAAFLQPPNFDPAADDAVNYGAIGATIGHEMGHGFDDQGSKSDAKGIKRNWWTDEDRSKFEARTKVLGEQFSGYQPVEGYFIDGDFTMGENIGDLGGLEVAYLAYQLSLKGEPAPVIDGYTGDQRFFLSYAHTYRSKYREELTLRLLKSDPHSPPQYRVNGVVRNMAAWYDAFDVKADKALFIPEEQRASIW
ncbi:MAG: putative endopeptidase [Candidatus Azotimanducaceae bacterium]|jgi:putative endopeptidase